MEIRSLMGHASLQATPNIQFLAQGVPCGGCFDPSLGNLLQNFLGLPQSAPLIEIAQASLTIHFSETTDFAWVGGNYNLFLDDAQVHPWMLTKIRPGMVLKVLPEKNAMRAWLGFGSSIQIDKSSLAGQDESGQSPLTTGDLLVLGIETSSLKPWRFAGPKSVTSQEIRYVLTSGLDLASKWRSELLKKEFTVSIHSNRIGIRFEESIGSHTHEGKSEPAAMGTIQVPPDGKPIILGPDGPTTGGYPKLGWVISADYSVLAQASPLSKLRFQEVSIELSIEINNDFTRQQDRWLIAMRNAYNYFTKIEGLRSTNARDTIL